jgi:hypothetical protein
MYHLHRPTRQQLTTDNRAKPAPFTSLAALRLRRRDQSEVLMIRKLKSGKYRLYSRKPDTHTGHRRNLGTFGSRQAAQQHEREIQWFKRH